MTNPVPKYSALLSRRGNDDNCVGSNGVAGGRVADGDGRRRSTHLDESIPTPASSAARRGGRFRAIFPPPDDEDEYENECE
jgi:hypothetical protein